MSIRAGVKPPHPAPSITPTNMQTIVTAITPRTATSKKHANRKSQIHLSKRDFYVTLKPASSQLPISPSNQPIVHHTIPEKENSKLTIQLRNNTNYKFSLKIELDIRLRQNHESASPAKNTWT